MEGGVGENLRIWFIDLWGMEILKYIEQTGNSNKCCL